MTDADLPADVVTARRQLARDAERTCRLLREYAGKLHRIADDLLALGSVDEANKLGWTRTYRGRPDRDTLGEQVIPMLLRRRAVVAGMVEDHCRAASGMVEAGALPLAVKSELLLRLYETENALIDVREASRYVQQRFPRMVTGDLLADAPIPDLAALERRRKQARDAVPQPAG